MASNWYFEENGDRVGPVDDAGIQAAAAQGRISSTTLVWNEKMTDWAKASDTELRSSLSSSTGDDGVEIVEVSDEPYTALPQSEQNSNTASETASKEVAQCANCGGMFNTNELVDIDGASVCADCKPQYLRKLQEGGDVNSVYYRYAGFWIRAVAIILDGLIIAVVQFPLSILFGVLIGVIGGAMGGNETAGAVVVILIQLVNMLVSVLIQGLYDVLFLVKKGATPGKMAMGIRVINADGNRQISYGKAIGRYFAKMLNGFTLNIGYMMAGWDDEKRGLHDRICDTRVIYSK
ncbi:MAG: RDD family protein [Victivallales bacterium]|nr:RDD family protein [Victivallales bacterium]